MKNFFNSMTGRVFLVLLCGMLGAIALTFFLSDSERQRTISQFRDVHQVERAEQLTLALDALPGASREAFLKTAKRIGLRVESAQSGTREQVVPSDFALALRRHLGPDFQVTSLQPSAADCQPPHRMRSADNANTGRSLNCEITRITLRDGSLLRMTVLPLRSGVPPLRGEFLLALALFVCSIGVLAYLVARMTMRPLKQLAQAAFDLGRDLNHPPLALAGSSEIRQASSAFNAMQGRIRNHVQQRTQMLAAITHDLQTPLTRLRLRLEKVTDDTLRQKLIDDLSAMQDMVREGLELARSMASAEPMQRLDLDSLLDSICSDATDAGQRVSLSGQLGKSVLARPNTLRRCLINLIDNAVKYGQSAAVNVASEAAGVVIRIRDHGPGIAPDQLKRVFEPFYRIETSRSRQTGGTGLGLTIARNIAEQHGGILTLRNHPDGGLEVMLTLPQK
ncbi:MAG: HAMP domain-containing protein [Glaciimonas sp.]|nr:HAMP domain-containing protein [Glaciimonas sp.]